MTVELVNIVVVVGMIALILWLAQVSPIPRRRDWKVRALVAERRVKELQEQLEACLQSKSEYKIAILEEELKKYRGSHIERLALAMPKTESGPLAKDKVKAALITLLQGRLGESEVSVLAIILSVDLPVNETKPQRIAHLVQAVFQNQTKLPSLMAWLTENRKDLIPELFAAMMTL